MEKLKKKKLSNKWILAFLTIFMFIGSVMFSFTTIGYSKINDPSDVENSFNNLQFNIEEKGEATWDLSPNEINGEVEGSTILGFIKTRQNGTFTFKYVGDNLTTISFNYTLTLNGGECEIDGVSYTNNGSFVKTNMSKNTTVSIYIKSPSGAGNKTYIKITDISIASTKPVTFTLQQTLNGSYSFVNNEYSISEVSETIEIQTTGDEEFTLTAFPDNGYIFYGWIFNSTLVSQENPYHNTYGNDAIIYPIFTISERAVFRNNGSFFDNLDDAIYSAQNTNDKTIILVKSGSIEGGESEEQKKIYTISSGITLLIPNDSSYTMYKDEANYSSSYASPALYSNLTIGTYTSIVCQNNSSIYIGAFGSSAMGYNGAPSGAYGEIEFSDSTSNIILENGSYLYAYGYVTGEGTINAKYGSTVKELFQFTDWRGGTASSGMLSNSRKVFLFNQYYIQNIECNLKIEYGAIENICTAASMSIIGEKRAEATFIGKSGSNSSGMFKLQTNAVLEKKYNGVEDRLEFTLSEGSADLSSIIINPGVPIDSSSYVLPINSNITITIKSGTTVNVNQDIALLPGSKVIIENGGILNISNNVSIYAYDRNSWIGKGFTYNNVDISPIQYSAYNGKDKIRNSASLINSIIDINGTVNISSGSGVYSTRNVDSQTELNGNVANIFSSQGTGKIVYNGTPGNSTTYNNTYSTYQYQQSTPTYVKIDVSHTVLRHEKNDSAQYTYLDLGKTASDLQDVQIVYDNNQNKRVKKTNDETSFNIEFINEKNINDKNVVLIYENGEEFTFPTNNITNFSYSGFTLKKWYIPELGLFNPGEKITISLGKDVQAYAIWGGWVNFNGAYYYIDYNTGEFLNGLKRVEHYSENKTYIMKFDNGIFDIGYIGIYYDSNNNKNYYVASGIVQENSGLIKCTTNITTLSFEYIYVQSDNSLLTSGRYYIDTNLDSSLPSGYYNFDSNGYIIRDDTETTNSNGEVYIKDNFTYIDGIKVSYGLFVYDSHYYYSNINCEIVRDTTFYVSKTNDLDISEGLYYFDEKGRMYDQNFTLL